jgi:multimeric flavodoxin WrbA
MKAFFDSTGHLWASGGLVGKTAGWCTSTATQNGGQETTALTAVTQVRLAAARGYRASGHQSSVVAQLCLQPHRS